MSQGRKLLDALAKKNAKQRIPAQHLPQPPKAAPQPVPELVPQPLASPPKLNENENPLMSFFTSPEREVLNPEYAATVSRAMLERHQQNDNASSVSDMLHQQNNNSSSPSPSITGEHSEFPFENNILFNLELQGRSQIASETSPENDQCYDMASILHVKKKLFIGGTTQIQNLTAAETTPCNGPSVSYLPLSPCSKKRLTFGSTKNNEEDLGTAPLPDNVPMYATLTTVQFESPVPSDVLATDILTQNILSDAVQSEEVVIPVETVEVINENQASVQDDVQAEVVVQSEVTVQSEPPKQKRKRQAAPTTSTPPRKRQRNPELTKAAKIRTAYNLGIAHTTARGKERQARSMRPGCTGKCRRNCQAKLSKECRQQIFHTYYASGSKSAQWLVLAKYVKRVPVKRRTVVEDSPIRKTSYEYYLPDDTKKLIPVCQTMFLDTFDVSITVVHSAMKKNSPDKRGKHRANRRRTSADLIQNVKDHIKSFPKIESHYCREETKREYLDENLSVSKMYRMYVMSRGLPSPNLATLRQYQDIFNNCFNLGFYKPKKDQCSLCVRYEAIPAQDREKHLDLIKEWTQHTEAKVLVRNIRKEVKALSREDDKKGSMKVICFDLQKVFFCPKSNVGEFFYKRKISCYNLTIFDCTLKEATCFVWDMTVAGRGAAEIASCVKMFIEQEVAKGLKELHVFSDSCWSQNKNAMLFTMYNIMSQKYKIKIIHRYLQKGHTQMECDSVHARIEKKTRNCDIYTPQEWYGFIKSAKVQRPMYTVIQMKTENILNFKDVAKSSFLWDKVPVSKIHEIIIDPTTPGKIIYKKKLNDQGISCVIQSKKPGRPYNWVTFKPPQQYSGLLRLKAGHVKDLKWMIKKNLIPEKNLPFYTEITSPEFGVVHHKDGENAQDDYPQEIPQVDNPLTADNQEQEDEAEVDTPEDFIIEEREDGDGSGSDLYD